MQMTEMNRSRAAASRKNLSELRPDVNRKVFLWIYFFSFFTLYLGLIPDFPMNELIQKLKFVYLIYGAVMFAVNGQKRFHKATTAIFIVWALYIVIYSTLLRNPMVDVHTTNHFIMMSIYFGMLLVTYAEVRRNRCFYGFVAASYFSIALFLLIAGLMNLSQIVWNPTYIFKVILFNLRVRSDFGILGTSNYVGAFCFVALVLSFIYFNKLKSFGQLFQDKCALLMLFFDCYLYLIYGSASSRSPIASMLVFVALLAVLKFYKKWKQFIPIILIFILIVFIILLAAGFFDYVWKNSNRVKNVSVNQVAFEQVGNFWTGMGFVENGAFNRNSGFPWGIYTSSLDMFYVYLFYTTGLVGTIWMGSILLAMLVMMFKRRKHSQFDIMISMYISLLFYAYWENIVLTYRFWPFMVLFCVIFLFNDGSVHDEKAALLPQTSMEHMRHRPLGYHHKI